MISYDDFKIKYLGKSKGYPTDSQYKGECLSIAKLYIKECFGIEPPPSGTNSAYGYWSKFPSPLGTVFEKVLNTDDLIPQEGWIAIWKPWASNEYGHIAMVEKGCTKNILLNTAQNWTSKIYQKESNNYANVEGFLKPKVINSEGDNMTEQEKIMLEFIRANKITEGQLRQGYGYITDNIDKKVQDLTIKVNELTNQLANLTLQLKVDGKTALDWQTECKTANLEIETLKTQTLSASPDSSIFKEALNRLLQVFKIK